MVSPTLELTEGLGFTIAAGQSLSASVNTGNRVPIGLVMPAAWDAALITLQTSWDGSTFYDLYDQSGSEVSFTVDANRVVALQDTNLLAIGRLMRIRSGTVAAPVVQAAERVITVRMARPVTQ